MVLPLTPATGMDCGKGWVGSASWSTKSCEMRFLSAPESISASMFICTDLLNILVGKHSLFSVEQCASLTRNPCMVGECSGLTSLGS